MKTFLIALISGNVSTLAALGYFKYNDIKCIKIEVDDEYIKFNIDNNRTDSLAGLLILVLRNF